MRAPARKPSSALVREDGFTLIETLVAVVVLIIGLLGTFALVDTANGRDQGVRSREGALNLSRELLESARSLRFNAISSATLPTTLAAQVAGATSSGNVITVGRRNLAYATTVSVCSIDDSKDGIGSHLIAGVTFCDEPPVPAQTSPADSSPEDLKRVTTRVTWTDLSGVHAITQSLMLSASGQAVGLPMGSLTIVSPSNVGDPTAPVIPPAPAVVSPCAASSACFTAKAPGAQSIVFSVDGSDQTTGVTSDATGWHLAWNTTGLSDGAYKVEARAVDAFGVQGQPLKLVVWINRGTKSAPTSVAGGYNHVFRNGTEQQVVELQWNANPERNIVGYEVTDPSGATVCPTSGGFDPSTSCLDTGPPPPSGSSITYIVYPVYAGPTGATARGTGTPVSMSASAGSGGTNIHFGLSAATAVNTGAANPNCYAGAGTAAQHDMTQDYTGAATTTTGPAGNAKTIVFCSPMSFGTLLFATATVPFTATFSNTARTTCSVTWRVLRDAGWATPLGTGTFSIARGTRTVSQALPMTGFIAVAGEQLGLAFTTGAANCTGTSLVYGGSTATFGAGQPGSLDLTLGGGSATWPQPGPPTGLTAAAATPGPGTTLTWTPPSGAVSFYRIYRDGTDYAANRYDTCDTSCQSGSTFRWTDPNTGGTTHTYRVTAVGTTTTTPARPSMAESDFSAPVTR